MNSGEGLDWFAAIGQIFGAAGPCPRVLFKEYRCNNHTYNMTVASHRPGSGLLGCLFRPFSLRARGNCATI